MVQKLQDAGTINNSFDGGVYYVNYPHYKNKIMNGFSGTFGKMINSTIKNLGLTTTTVPLGHAGIITVDKDGHTKYYEFGRYHNTNFGVQKTNGNWKNVVIPDTKVINGEVDTQGLANKLSKQMGEQVELTFVDHADPKKAQEIIQTTANDKNRNDYNLFSTNCGTEARRIIKDSSPEKENRKDNIVSILPGIALPMALFTAIPTPSNLKRKFTIEGYPAISSQQHGGMLNYLNYIQ